MRNNERYAAEKTNNKFRSLPYRKTPHRFSPAAGQTSRATGDLKREPYHVHNNRESPFSEALKGCVAHCGAGASEGSDGARARRVKIRTAAAVQGAGLALPLSFPPSRKCR